MGGDDIKSLERKLERALSSGTASKERCEDLRTRLAAAERVFAQATTSKAKAEAIETSGSIMAIENIDKLTRKLARAEKESNQVRAVDLRERISRAEDAVKLQAHLTRKLARALRAGDETRVETIHARAKAANITLTSSDDIEEREIWREHGSVVNKASASGVSTSTSTAAILTVGGGGGGGSGGSGAAATAATGDVDPHEGMVLAKNGKWYPKPVPPPPGNTSLLLFYAYVQPPWTPAARAAAISFTRGHLEGAGCGGRLRVALEGFNGTLSGNAAGIRSFCAALASYDPKHFSNIDFKVVDGLSDSKAFRNLKVWPVDTLVNYGFDSTTAPLTLGGTHVSPKKWTELAAAPRTIMVDVRNANESAIGRFAPPPGGAQLLDPHMRRSTEFSDWVDNNLEKLKGADKVLMYCTAGIRCERASALLATKGVDRTAIFQLEGGIHRYLDAFPEDGGIWEGKNYTFDKRFSHGATKSVVVGKCAGCAQPWERYQAQDKCSMCKMEVIVCRECERAAGKSTVPRFLCTLCVEAKGNVAATARARAFAASGGRDGEGEGRSFAAALDDDITPRRDPSGAGERSKRGRFT